MTLSVKILVESLSPVLDVTREIVRKWVSFPLNSLQPLFCFMDAFSKFFLSSVAVGVIVVLFFSTLQRSEKPHNMHAIVMK